MKVLLFFFTALYVLLELAFRCKFLEIAGYSSFNPKSVEIIEVIGRSISSFGIAMFIALFMHKKSSSLKLTGLVFIISLLSLFHLQKFLIDNVGLITPDDFYKNAPEIFVMKNNIYNINDKLNDKSKFIFNFDDEYTSVDKSTFINLPIYLYARGNHKSDKEEVMKKHREIYSTINTSENRIPYFRLIESIERKIRTEYKEYSKISDSYNKHTDNAAFDKNLKLFKSKILQSAMDQFKSYRKAILSTYIRDIHKSGTLRNRSIQTSRLTRLSKLHNQIEELQSFGRSDTHEIIKYFESITTDHGFISATYYDVGAILTYKGVNIDFDSYNQNGIIHNEFKFTNFFNKVVVDDSYASAGYQYKFRNRKTNKNSLDDEYINDYFEKIYIDNRRNLRRLGSVDENIIFEFNRKLLASIDELYTERLNFYRKDRKEQIFQRISPYMKSIERKIQNPKLDFSAIETDLLKIQYEKSQFINKYDYNFSRDINSFNDFLKTRYFQEKIKKDFSFKGIKIEGELDIKNDAQIKRLFVKYFNRKTEQRREVALRSLGTESLPLGLDFNSFIYHKEVFNNIKQDYPFLVYGTELLINKEYPDVKDKMIYNFNKMTYEKITNVIAEKGDEQLSEYNKANVVPIIVLFISTIVLLLNIYGLMVFFLNNKKIKVTLLLIFLTFCIIPAFENNEYSDKDAFNTNNKYNYALTWIVNLSATLDNFSFLAFPLIIALDHAEINYITIAREYGAGDGGLEEIYYRKRRGELVRKLRALDLY